MAVTFAAGSFCGSHSPGQVTLSLDWVTWDPRPVPGDLVAVLSTEPLSGVPADWTLAEANCACVIYRDGLPVPLFTAVNSSQPWKLLGYVAQLPGSEGSAVS